jgi:hypothetical protein
MQLAVRLNTGRDYVIAGIVLAILLLAVLFTASSVRTAVVTAVG